MLTPLPATSAEWHALRLKNIGGSEVAALFGVAPPYALSLFALHQVKSGAIPAPDVVGERIEWGIALEPYIAKAAANKEGWKLHPAVYATDDTTPGMAATLDYRIEAGPAEIALGMTGIGILQIKNVDGLVFRTSWTNDEPPLHILLQLHQEIACAGAEWGVITALVGGNQLRTYRYWANLDVIASIRERITAFWTNVRSGNAPDVDGAASTADAIRAMYPEVWDDAIDMSSSNEWSEAVSDFINAAKAKKKATATYDEAKNRVAALLGPYKRGYGGGYSVSTVVTKETPARPAIEGEIIPGRASSRRYIPKEMTA